ncbi:MAG: hypoxanthine-guanine phosphoribosyltransferase [Pseudomonadales bacterium]|nr:hypoxanthine-guanine phosphoribosyltransferase [Pseudomonadales bacterium]
MAETSPDHYERVYRQADCLFSLKEIDAALEILSKKISHNLGAKNPLVICLMNGGLITAGHLLTKLDFLLQVDYLHATRYREAMQGSDDLQWLVKPHHAIEGRHVLLVDDILDEGMTLFQVSEFCRAQGAASVSCAVIVEKIHDRRSPPGFKAEYTGLEVPDRYVFGFGMDYKGYLRNAPGIFAVSESHEEGAH